MKLSRPLTEAEQAKLSSVLVTLQAAYAETAQAQKTQDDLHARLHSLEADHVRLEAQAASGSVQASSELHGVLDQKRRCLEGLQANEAGNAQALFALRPAINDAQQAVSITCTADLYEQLADRIEAAMRPFYKEASRARMLARETDSAAALGAFFNGQLGSTLWDLLPHAERLLLVLPKLLAGADLFSLEEEVGALGQAPAPAAPRRAQRRDRAEEKELQPA